jgi:hypothetical protein
MRGRPPWFSKPGTRQYQSRGAPRCSGWSYDERARIAVRVSPPDERSVEPPAKSPEQGPSDYFAGKLERLADLHERDG